MCKNLFKRKVYIKIKHMHDFKSNYDYIPSTMNIYVANRKGTQVISEIDVDKDNIKSILANLIYAKNNKYKYLRIHSDVFYIDVPKWAFKTLINQIANYFDEWSVKHTYKKILKIEENKIIKGDDKNTTID